jgi:hypothetical protein
MLAALLLAAACADAAEEADAESVAIAEPTREEIRDAYRRRVAEVNIGAVETLGAEDAKAVALTMEDAQKLSCTALDRGDAEYDCRVELRTRLADDAPKTRLVNLWLIREGGTWVVR